MSTIYKLNFSNGEFYIGKTTLPLNVRIGQHTRTKGKGCPLLEHAWHTYEYLGYEILEEDIPDDLVNATEIYYIKTLDPKLNSLPGGESLAGLNHPRCKYTEEQLLKVGALLLHTNLSYQEISDETNVLLSTVRDIAFKRTHGWLIDALGSEHIDEARRRRSKEYTLYDKDNVPYVFDNCTEFSKEHGFNVTFLMSGDLTSINQKGWSALPKPVFTVVSKDETLTGTRFSLTQTLKQRGLCRQQISQIFTTISGAKGFKLKRN